MEEIIDTSFEYILGFRFNIKYHKIEVKGILDWKEASQRSEILIHN